jgi:hypothetical protein
LRFLSFFAFLALSGCASVQPFSVVSDQRSLSHSLPSISVLDDDFEISSLLELPDEMGFQSISVGLSPVCDVVAVVVMQAANLSSSCSATGRLSYYYAGASRIDAINILFHALRDIGAKFAIEGASVLVSGGNASEERSATIGDDENQYFPVIARPSQGTVQSFTRSVKMRPLPIGANIDEIRQIAETMFLSVSFTEYNGRKFIVSSDGPALDAVFSYLSGFSETSLFLPVPDIHKSAASTIAQRDLSVVATEGGLHLTGNSASIANALSDIRKITPVTEDYKINAVFLSFSRSNSDDFSAEILGRGASRSGSMGYLLRGSSFSALVDFARSKFSASVSVKPSLSVTSGSSASFQAGQSVPIQSATRSDGETFVTTEFRDVGVQLTVTPVPVGRLVRLLVVLEVSNLDAITDAGPLINTQRIQTTIEIAPGDLVVLGGLDDVSKSARASAGLLTSARRASSERSLQIVLQLASTATGFVQGDK